MTENGFANPTGKSNIRKLTGPPEHWLTTFNTKFWGLELKYSKTWDNDIRAGDMFVLHSTNLRYLGQRTRTPTGIIGVAVVGGKSRKKTKEWIAEIEGRGDWPLLIHFSKIWWLGDTGAIIDEPIVSKLEKGKASIIRDVLHLTEDCITFTEMKASNCRIPAQGSIRKIGDRRAEKLKGLIWKRIGRSLQAPSEDL